MRKIMVSMMFFFLCIGYSFAAYPITYVRENDPQTKKSAHQAIAIPSYLKSVNYSDLITKGQEYEKAGKWIYAYGTYVDASAISNGDSEGKDKAEEILSVISNGKPGKGTFDVFTLYDKWVDLITESEKYFTEFPAFEIELKEPVQKEIHYDTRTADYEVTINTYFTEKANNLYEALQKGFERAKKDDWKIKPWFLNGASSDRKGRSIKALEISNDDFISRTPALEKLKTVVTNGQKEGIAIVSWLNTYNPYEDDKHSSNNTHYCAQLPSFFASVYIEEEEWARSRRFMDGRISLYDLEISLFDKQEKMLAKSVRVNLEELGRNANSSWFPRKGLFKNLDRDVMSKIEAGEVVAKATGLYLHYGVLTVPSTETKYSNELITNTIRKLPEMKIDLGKAVIYNSKEMLAKLDETRMEFLIKKEPRQVNGNLYYGYISEYSEYGNIPHYKALANYASQKAGLKSRYYQVQDGEKIYDSSRWILEITNEYQRLKESWDSILFDETATGFFIESEGPYYSEEDIDNAFYRIKYYRSNDN